MFRMMTSDTRPTRGDVFLAGWRLNFSVPSSLARLATGYCPQSGGLTVALTALEILEFYARVRGLPSAAVPAAVEHVLAALSLEEHARVPVRALSGGNKRRLSVAAALIGAPQVRPTATAVDRATGRHSAVRMAPVTDSYAIVIAQMWHSIGDTYLGNANAGGRSCLRSYNLCLRTQKTNICKPVVRRWQVLTGAKHSIACQYLSQALTAAAKLCWALPACVRVVELRLPRTSALPRIHAVNAGDAVQVLLLDEPSTGMDPTARRRLWAALQSARHAGHTIVLTSHAMADADVLCTRVGILVNVRALSRLTDGRRPPCIITLPLPLLRVLCVLCVLTTCTQMRPS